MPRSHKIPRAMEEKFGAIATLTDAFCDQRLNAEYGDLIHAAIAALSRRRPSPLLKGKDNAWAAGIVHALGMVNFLFDPSQTPHCKAPDIYAYFGVGASTGQAKSKEVRDILGMRQLSPAWTLTSQLEKNPLVWMLEINGLIIDVRTLPADVQRQAYEQGLIPFIPGDRPEDQR